MPYVPRDDRPELDAAALKAAEEMAERIDNNFSLVKEYREFFDEISDSLSSLENNRGWSRPVIVSPIAKAIFDAGEKHGYQGAFLGELNYTITRFLQHLPRAMVKTGRWKNTDEIRYWLYACAVEALVLASDHAKQFEMGIGGVWKDIKDEYKWRVNRPYETAQILKSGDCYDSPHYNRLVKVQDANGNEVGYIYVDLVRPKDGTIHPDVLGGVLKLS